MFINICLNIDRKNCMYLVNLSNIVETPVISSKLQLFPGMKLMHFVQSI